MTFSENILPNAYLANTYLIDTHCHLNLGHLKLDVDQYVQNASKAGVKYLHTICTQMEDFAEILEIAEKYENIYCSTGIHPCNVKAGIFLSADDLLKIADHKKVISFGETGLDYYHPGFDKELQKSSFVNHINAARVLQLPIIVHTRDASHDTLDIITSEMKNGDFPGIIHCFSEDYEFARKVLDLGFYISFSGILTFKNAVQIQEVARKMPRDRILVETDAPYLAPMPFRGKPNEPAYVRHTAEFLAGLLGVPFAEIASITSGNAARVLSKMKL